MSFACIPVAREQAETLLPILRDAEEGDERIRAAFLDPACVAYAASVNGTLVGAAVVRWEEGENSELLSIAVLASERGKGYGKQIIAALQAELPVHGQALLVGTANSSLENIAFYQKCGFRMFQVRRNYFAYIQPSLQEHGIIMRDMLVFRYDLGDFTDIKL
ncbi:MAG TPA: GNAT family N-acetyltransferase [Ktedonobacteraceae bacterium]|jgi:ribosomal protein S18 acetylase RimI-like enzyme